MTHNKKIKIIGVGGAGGKFILSYSLDQEIDGIDLVIVDDDMGKIPSEAGSNISKIILDDEKKSHAKIASLLKGAEIIFIVAGIGGLTGTKISLLIGQIAKDFNISANGIFFTPFAFEGTIRNNTSNNTIPKLKDIYTSSIFYQNDELILNADKNTPVDDILLRKNKELCNTLSSNIKSNQSVQENKDTTIRKEYSNLVDPKDYFQRSHVYFWLFVGILLFYGMYDLKNGAIEDFASTINYNIEYLPRNIEDSLNSCFKDSDIIEKKKMIDCLQSKKLDYFHINLKEENESLIKY